MASLCCSAPPSQFNLGFRRLNCRPDRPSINVLNLRHQILPESSILRYKSAVKFQLNRRFLTAFTSNAIPSDGEAITEKSNGENTGSDETPKGPPLLTILAGFLVLALVIWIIGSIVVWLLSLIFTVPPSK